MFASAVKSASAYTHPVVISTRDISGKVASHCATYIILNEEGWILTASHVFNSFRAHQAHAHECKVYEEALHKIETNATLIPKEKRKQIAALKKDPTWLTHSVYWWSANGVVARDITCHEASDLAIARLEPFDGNTVSNYPIFKNPDSEFAMGKSLCRLGFPFYELETKFDVARNHFDIPTAQLGFFPNDGLFTRVIIAADKNTGTQAKFIETSTPGLIGQSGGPIFDVSGEIWGLQSRTINLPLGFSPTLKNEQGKEFTEYQFMNLGWGTHVEEVVGFLRAHNVQFRLAGEDDLQGPRRVAA